MIQSIRPNGTIEFLTLGGWQNNTLPGTKICFRNALGEDVIGIPVRYIHSPNCYASYSDYLDGIKLAKVILTLLKDDIIDSF